jgi:hypothetical protein
MIISLTKTICTINRLHDQPTWSSTKLNIINLLKWSSHINRTVVNKVVVIALNLSNTKFACFGRFQTKIYLWNSAWIMSSSCKFGWKLALVFINYCCNRFIKMFKGWKCKFFLGLLNKNISRGKDCAQYINEESKHMF